MKKIIIIILLVIILIIPLFMFNNPSKKQKKITIKKEIKNEEKERFKYITIGHDNINEYIKEEEVLEEKVIYVCIE